MITFSVVSARLYSQGVFRVEELDTDFCAAFKRAGFVFSIPKPDDGEIYSDRAIAKISDLLERFGLELLPLDP